MLYTHNFEMLGTVSDLETSIIYFQAVAQIPFRLV